MCNHLSFCLKSIAAAKMHLWQFLFASILFSALPLPRGFAQGTFSFVVPPGTGNIEGDSSTFVIGGHYQFMETSGAFPTTLPSEGLWITQISLRLNVSPGSIGGENETFSAFQLSLSTNPRLVAGNYFVPGSDQAVTFSSGPVTFKSPIPSRPGPADFTIIVPFQNRFFYRPGANLLVDLNLTPAGANDGFILDFASSPTATSIFPAGLGTIAIESGSPPILFNYDLVPEPASIEFFLVCALIIAVAKKFQSKTEWLL
jgi:hypothetical protein